MAASKDVASAPRGASAPEDASAPDWLAALRAYLLTSAAGHLAWEVAQLPLYSIWSMGTLQEIAFAVAHCTGGDLVIAMACLVLALVLAGSPEWPSQGFGRVGLLAGSLGIAYTVYSEWLNAGVRQAWTYSDLMPIVPFTGIGASPLLQWLVVPSLALLVARRQA